MRQLSFDFFTSNDEAEKDSQSIDTLKTQPSIPDVLSQMRTQPTREKKGFDLTPVFSYHLERAKRKTVGFIVDERGVTVRAPRWVSVAEIERMLQEKEGWIQKKLTEFGNWQKELGMQTVRFVDGAQLPYLGEPLKLRLEPAARSVFLSEGKSGRELIVNAAKDTEEGRVKDWVQVWFKKEAERQNGTFKDIFDFVSRMESSKLNSKMLDSLIMAGAFDEFKLNRTTIKQNLHKIMEYAELKNSIGIDEPPILTIVRDNRIKVLEEEKMVLGVYLTMHPIALIKNNLKEQIVNLNELSNYIDQPVRVIMALSRVKVIVDKKGQEMCFVDGYDETGEVDAVVFASSFQVLKKILVRGEICLIEGRVNYRDKLSLIINQAKNVR